MEIENEQKEDEITPVESAEEKVAEVPPSEEDDAAFEAGFSEIRGEEVTPEAKAEPESKEEAETSTEQAASGAQSEAKENGEAGNASEEEEQPVLAGLTETQIKTLFGRLGAVDELQQSMGQLRDQAFGKIGEINRNIQSMQSRGAAGSIDPKKLGRVAEEYGQEFAEALAADLNQSLSPGQGMSQEQVLQVAGQLFKKEKAQLERRYSMNLLKMAHRDFDTVMKSADWGVWLQSQEAKERAEILKSEDPLFAADKITEFKQWRDQQSKQKESNVSVLERSAERRTKKPAPVAATVSDDDAFLEGFKAVRGV